MISSETGGLFSTSAEFPKGEQRFVQPYHKLVLPDIAKIRIREWQKQGQKVVMIDGVVDIPHLAHAEYFLACANLGDRLILRVNSDAFVASRKDPRGPIVSWQERAMHAAHYPYIDLITSKDEGGWNWLNEYNPDIIVKSTTSGKVVLDEIEHVRSYIGQLNTEIVVMDEYANIVQIEQAYEKSLKYEQEKFTTERISDSRIRAEIIKRAIPVTLKDFTEDDSFPLK